MPSPLTGWLPKNRSAGPRGFGAWAPHLATAHRNQRRQTRLASVGGGPCYIARSSRCLVGSKSRVAVADCDARRHHVHAALGRGDLVLGFGSGAGVEQLDGGADAAVAGSDGARTLLLATLRGDQRGAALVVQRCRLRALTGTRRTHNACDVLNEFLIALLVRSISVGALALKIDPDAATVSPHSTLQRVRIAIGSGRWRVAVFLAVMMFGAHVSVPFFTPFMLRTLQLGMLSYSLLCAVALLCKALSFSLWRRMAEHFGMHAVLLTSVVLTTLLPVQWVWASSVSALTLVQIVSGAAWGGFEYASLQLLLRDAPPTPRSSSSLSPTAEAVCCRCSVHWSVARSCYGRERPITVRSSHRRSCAGSHCY